MKIFKIAKKVNGHSYSWVFINLPKEIKDMVLELGNQIDPDDLYTKEADGGLEKEPHVTVKYGLLTTSPKEVKQCLDKAKGGKVTIVAASVFNCDEYDVVKLSVESKTLNELHCKLNSLQHHDKYPEYKAHVTIAYVKKGKGKKYEGKFKLNKSFSIKECYFGNNERDYKIILAKVNKMILASVEDIQDAQMEYIRFTCPKTGVYVIGTRYNGEFQSFSAFDSDGHYIGDSDKWNLLMNDLKRIYPNADVSKTGKKEKD